MAASPWTAWLVDGVGRDGHDFSERLRNIVRPRLVLTRQAGRDGSEPCPSGDWGVERCIDAETGNFWLKMGRAASQTFHGIAFKRIRSTNPTHVICVNLLPDIHT